MLLLASCGPVSVYYKPGAPVAKLRDDALSCEVAALKDAPVSTVQRQTSPTFVPPRRICNGDGRCRTYGGYWEPGIIYTEDTNEDLRDRLEQRCMAQRGYTEIAVPRCTAGTRASGVMTVLPSRVTEQTCAVQSSDGALTLVTPAP